MEPVDGDTLRMPSNQLLRLWGVDAPERDQQGWSRQGRSVPIGQASLDTIATALANQEARPGPVQGQSYGRLVAPVTIGDMDLGRSLLRGGNALAASDFLSGDPERRFDYLQSERLARLNALGMHDTFHQTPAEHRDNPGFMPDRETVARFWDTPTPFAGMRPEVEKRFVAMLNDTAISPEDVAAFARDNGGFVVDPEEVRTKRDKARKKGQPIGMNYSESPKPMTDLGDGATGAAVRGVGSGVLASGLDEAGAFVDTVGLTPGRENIWNSDRRLADIWSNNQQQNSSILGYDDYAHPYAKLGGEIAGGLVVPFGAKARTVPQLFRVGAAYGGAEGFLGTDGDVGQRAIGGAVGVPVGGTIGAGAGKTIELLSPHVRRLVERFTVKPVLAAPEGVSGPQGDIPPPPDGFALDESPAASVPTPLRQRDYLDMSTVRTHRLDQPISDAQMQAITENITPADVVPIPSNVVADVEEAAARDAGRYAPVRPADERAELTRQTVRGWNGSEVPKVGPIDLVGWLRLNGGLADQGGELAHMGLNNAARKMDFVGQEQRFGPLVNESGMTLDDAALRAWEAGYFPDHADRPSINTFLDALRETHTGGNRRFLPDDLAEVDRFHSAQAERIELEKRIAEDGPIYQDRSVPADEPQPIPPVQAYEEWPAGGPDFAGNINLTKLESPQDIARALATTEKRVGFDAATRGRVTQAETERLAAELNLTPEKLIARRKGQAFNAEEALAARQLLAKSGNELVNAAKKIRALDEPGDELLAEFRQKWMRHVAIQEQVSGMTAEAGRALQQFRMAADSRAVRGDVLSALVRGGGGKDNLKDAADALIDAMETSPGVFNALAQKAAQPKWRDKISELYINFLLSNPATHAVNMLSNTLTSVAQIPEYAAGATIGTLRRTFTRDTDRVTAREVGARAFGLLQGAREGARLFAQALRTGEASDFASKVEGEQYKAIKGLKGEAIRLPTRFLTAEDEFFKGIARRMELNAEAVRIAHREGLNGEKAKQRIAELVADPTDEMFERALEYGRYLTFQRKLGPFAQKVSGLTNDSLVAKTFLPFVRTPTNLVKFAAERSPAAPLLREWRKDFMAGGARRDMALARMMLGTGFGMAMYEAALNDRLTGSAPSDPKKARLLYADGWKPYSVRIGDTYYSYKRLDPFSTTIGVAADLATLPDGMSERQRDDKTTLLVASIMGNLASKTWLSGVSDVVSALHEPDRYAGSLLQRLVASFLLPNAVAGTARTLDPTSRQTDSIGEELQSRIPGLRDDLLPNRDIWGREIRNEGGLGPDFLSPVWVSKALEDPVNHELLQLDYAPSLPGKKIGSRELTPVEHDRYVEISGKLAHERLTGLVTSAEWRSLDDDAKTKAAEKVVRDARRDARNQLFGVGEGEQSPRGSHDALPPPPPAFEIEGESGGRNVYRDLQHAIPGIKFTSGYRNEAYQADMRKRGYKPARNSGHLDGSSFDVLPPEGKSMGWLKGEIRRFDPKARMLDEGNHLHLTIPGYYGAPAIGGAKSAGLKNPLAGMPPPPAGFKLDAR